MKGGSETGDANGEAAKTETYIHIYIQLKQAAHFAATGGPKKLTNTAAAAAQYV